jgi:hypothetical protein
MTRTYWKRNPRDFHNEYDIGMATTQAAADAYAARGYGRIIRKRALRNLIEPGDAATEYFQSGSVNGEPHHDHKQLARELRRHQG